MADKTIGDLNNAPGTVDDSNTLFVVQQSGTAYKLDGHAFILALSTILDGHGGVASVTYTPPVAPSLTGTMVVTLADQSTTSVSIQNGKGISSIAKTGTSGLVDTYTITYNDNTTSTFTITNGAKGETGNAWYVWIRYAGQQPTQDSDMGTTPDDWMGIYSGTSSTAPAHYTSYQWFEIKGEKGDTGTSITSIVKTGGTGDPGTVDTYTAYAGTTAVGTFTVYNGLNGTGAVSTVNGQAPDGNGNVSLTATDIPTSDSNTVQAKLTSLDTDKQAKITASGMLKGSGTAVSEATKGTDYGAKSFTITLTVAGWSNNAQTVTDSNFVTSGYGYVVTPASASFSDYASAVIYADNVTTANQMTFHCENVPDSAITVNIMRVVSA